VKGTFYPVDLALTCDESTPIPVRNEYLARDSENAFGNACVERNSGATGLSISKIDIIQDKAFREPIYEVRIHVDQRDQRRLYATMLKAARLRRTLAFVVHEAVVSQGLVTDAPKDGVIMIGGFGSVKEAEAVAARFTAK
jgi:hypothetical protein